MRASPDMQDRASLLSVVGVAMATLGCPSSLVEGTTGAGSSASAGGEDDGQDGGGDGDGDGSTPTSSGVATTEMTAGTTGLATAETGETGETMGSASETMGSASETMGSASETMGSTGDCGDGVVGEGETCDLGYLENRDDGACTKGCQLATCGDGLVWAGKEQCDQGMANNDSLYGGCLESCAWGPRCNDGVLQPEEECDASAPTTEGAVKCDAGNCRLQARVAFVTSATFSADLGGLAGADAACIAAAKAGKLDNADSFLAYLGDGVSAPANRFTDGAKDKGFPGLPADLWVA